MNPRLFQYAILWHPTEKQIKDDGKKSLVLVELQTVLAKDEKSAAMAAAMAIPNEYRDQLDQIDVAIRPF